MASKDLGLVRPNVSPDRNFEYGGKNLLEVFTDVNALSSATIAGDFTDVNNGDYLSVTISGTFRDYATSTDKSINRTFKFEAMPDFFINTNGIGTNHHILFLSRDLIGQNLQFRSENSTWYNTGTDNPWLGSALYETFNNTTNGLRKLFESSILAGHIYDPDGGGRGIRQYAEKKAAGAASATSWDNYYRGALFIPTETEVWGHAAFSEARVLGNANAQQSLQWPIFRDSYRHIQKGNSVGGRTDWWVASSAAGSAASICFVDGGGMPGYISAAYTLIGAPVGFLFR